MSPVIWSQINFLLRRGLNGHKITHVEMKMDPRDRPGLLIKPYPSNCPLCVCVCKCIQNVLYPREYYFIYRFLNRFGFTRNMIQLVSLR